MELKKGIRTNTYWLGRNKQKKVKYIEVDIFPFEEPANKKSRGKKKKISAPKQKNLNDKTARRYFQMLLKSNFGSEDFHLTLSYGNEYLPDNVTAAEKELRNYLRRLKRLYKKSGQKLKYVYVTEMSAKGRIHHHLIINGTGINRDDVEKSWGKGWANAKRIQIMDNGLETLAAYLSKDPKGKKRWGQSRDLRKPEKTSNDSKTSRRKFNQICLMSCDCADLKNYFEKQHNGYRLTSFEKYYNEFTASYYLRAKLELKNNLD